MNQLQILNIITQNQDKDFVKRLVEYDKYPDLFNRDGTYSTHGLMWVKSDDRWVVYPSVVYEEGEMMRLGPDTALGRALRMDDYIVFDSEEEARQFAKGFKETVPFYKKRDSIWKNDGGGPGDAQDSMTGSVT